MDTKINIQSIIKGFSLRFIFITNTVTCFTAGLWKMIQSSPSKSTESYLSAYRSNSKLIQWTRAFEWNRFWKEIVNHELGDNLNAKKYLLWPRTLSIHVDALSRKFIQFLVLKRIENFLWQNLRLRGKWIFGARLRRLFWKTIVGACCRTRRINIVW